MLQKFQESCGICLEIITGLVIAEDRDSEVDGGDGAYGFLHPDHAYLAGSRRGSSQSEQLEVEPYQLNRDFSRSLPGSRRSSFQSTQNNDKGK